MKKGKFLVLFPLLTTLLFSGCADLINKLHDKVNEKSASISLNFNDVNCSIGNSFRLIATTSSDSDLVWSSSNSNVATVNNGVVTILDDSNNVGKTIEITAKIKGSKSAYQKCKFTITNKKEISSKYTIMFYMCASTLEYDPSYDDTHSRYYGYPQPYLFTADIKEILSAGKIPDDVNIIIETGGATKWSFELGIRNDKLQRWSVEWDESTHSNKLTLMETLNTNKMADEDSFESFINWGITNFEAEQMGLVISGHGGGIAGCAYDENYTYLEGENSYTNTLNSNEILNAVKKAFSRNGRDRFTWIGYDCCLMQCADIASVNSDYFDYMVASQEYEDGHGWDHDSYLPSLYSNTSISPEVFLPQICSSFLTSTHDVYCQKIQNDYDECFQTLSVLDLRKMYKLTDAINDYVRNVGVSLSNYTKFKLAFLDSYNLFGDAIYGLADMKDFIIKLSARFENISTKDLTDALEEIVIANNYCSQYETKPCGLNAFFPKSVSTNYVLQPGREDYSGNFSTKFTSYQSMCLTYGGWAW